MNDFTCNYYVLNVTITPSLLCMQTVKFPKALDGGRLLISTGNVAGKRSRLNSAKPITPSQYTVKHGSPNCTPRAACDPRTHW